MIDLHVKFAIVAAFAWIVTRRVTPSNAAGAHRLWVAVAASPLLWLAGEWMFVPLAYAGLREGLLPAVIASPSRQVWTVVAAVYVSVAALLLGRVCIGVLSVRRLIAASRPLHSVDRVRLPLASGTVREAELDVPVTAGFFRPVILLPSTWRLLPADGLEAILRHEWAHVRRRDCAVTLICAIVESLLWVNPFAWLATRQVRWFAEMACDGEATRGMDGRAYASELLALATAWRGTRTPLYAITAGVETNVVRRIDLLLDDLERSRRRRLSLPAIAALFLVAVPLSGNVRFGSVSASASSMESFDSGHGITHQLRHRH